MNESACNQMTLTLEFPTSVEAVLYCSCTVLIAHLLVGLFAGFSEIFDRQTHQHKYDTNHTVTSS